MAKGPTKIALLPLWAVDKDMLLAAALETEGEVTEATQVPTLAAKGTALPMQVVVIGMSGHHLTLLAVGDLVECMRLGGW